MRKIGSWALALPLAVLVAMPARGDVVVDWNNALLNAIRTDKTNPPRATRAMAIVHVSVFDAVDAILGGYEPYHVEGPAPAGASPEAAAAAAAHRALVELFPAQTASFDATLAASLATVPAGAARDAGVAWGEAVAEEILALRAGDGADDVLGYTVPEGAGWWVRTPPAFAPPLLPNWAHLRPWTMVRDSQFRVAAPPPPNSPEYTASFEEVRRLGSADSPERTPDQTQVAYFWEDGPGSYTPPGHWQAIAQHIVEQRAPGLVEDARLFALLGLTVADAAIVSWDNKYAYSNWRPYTGIHEAESDGNEDTQPDPGWTNLIPTPPFPTYTSGHSTFSGSSSKILELFFGSDAIPFTDPADPGRWPEQLTGVSRSFASFSQAAEEAGQSRIYGGIHWQYDNQGGLSSGRALARYVFFNFLTPQAGPGACTEGPTTLCLGGGRFEVTATWRTSSEQGAAGAAADGPVSGRFWFFDPDNTELSVKVIDACPAFGHFWVFVSGLTDVETRLTVTDRQAGRTRHYFNPAGQAFVPIQDTTAFATCP